MYSTQAHYPGSWSIRSLRVLLSCALLCAWAAPVHAQLRNANWVIADGLWISFLNEDFTFLEPPYVPTPRNACISDTAGQFALLVDDTGIRNATFELMPGGRAEDLGWSGTPAANYLVLPDPAAAHRYYVLINEAPPGQRAGYVHVDLDANAGLGAIVEGTTWYMHQVTAKLHATLDAEGSGYWIVQHADTGNAFHSFHLQASGWPQLPVISEVGSAFVPDTTVLNPDRWGHMRFSEQGDQLAMIKHGPNGDTNNVEVFHFDPATGALDFRCTIRNRTYYWRDSVWTWYPVPDPPEMFDLEFDPTGRKLYVLTWDSTEPYLWRIQQTLLYDTTMASTPDSLTTGYFAGNSMHMTQMDRNGRYFAWGMDKHFYTHTNSQAHILFRFHLYFGSQPNGPNPWFQTVHTPSLIPVLSLPLFCKRYHDSEHSVGYTQVPPRSTAVLRLRPNPMVDRAVLEVPGHAGPMQLRWRDTMGRLVQQSTTEQRGPTQVVQRNGLPPGLYLLEAWEGTRLLGTARVVCE